MNYALPCKSAAQSEQLSGEKMKTRISILAASLVLIAIPARAQDAPPLKLAQTITLPPDATGQFDHFGIDLKGDRLFATPEGSKSVRVFELKSGKPIHTIAGIEKPHAVLYREDLDRIYVTDGEAGDLKIFDAKTYKLLSTVKLLEDADSIGYDAKTKYLYIDNGGGDVHQTYSMLSVVDTTEAKKVADIKIDGETLEAMALESSTSRLYVNNKARNKVDVVDRNTRAIVASWPVTKCKTNVAMALDEANHRLFMLAARRPWSLWTRNRVKKSPPCPLPRVLTTLSTMPRVSAFMPPPMATWTFINRLAPMNTNCWRKSPRARWQGQLA